MIRIAVAVMMVAAGFALPAQAAERGTPALTVELNRMQAEPSGCRLDFVVRNGADFVFESIQPELAFMGADGVCWCRAAFSNWGLCGPIRPGSCRSAWTAWIAPASGG